MIRTVLALFIAALAIPPAAFGQRGVFVDPDSPAGKEYAIPLEEARRQAAGGDGEGGNRRGGQPLFGEGIQPADGSSGDGSAGDGGGSDGSPGDGGASSESGDEGGGGKGGGGDRGAADRANGNGNGDGSLGAEDLAPDRRSTAAIEASASDGSDMLLTAGIAGSVLAVGLLAGFGLRRVLRSE
jgi:hypothetical protein